MGVDGAEQVYTAERVLYYVNLGKLPVESAADKNIFYIGWLHAHNLSGHHREDMKFRASTDTVK